MGLLAWHREFSSQGRITIITNLYLKKQTNKQTYSVPNSLMLLSPLLTLEVLWQQGNGEEQ
jgi:hypothetical protein